ncbi:hypothetical protein P154DRAFT_519583 [Amniculicola lignicola CBS 123094]|uniref:GST C-terminal domain-containing protein n=1 Tax=Amniculicola lignicola CBS 123094 TaxID=1392246 RepID=A0A6A5WT78_9PLEO|nr:hypothetical protein P154DRAFT_519583 [Amniculicola lignicola CBS 123094]
MASPKITIWLWMIGLFPRRIIYYLVAKKLKPTHLSTHQITLVPVTWGPGGTLVSLDQSLPTPPTGISVPHMVIQKPGAPDFHVSESGAIMEYLEELFGNETEGELAELKGHTPEQRARTGDVISLVNDFIQCIGVHLVNSHPASLPWSGISREEWSTATADFAQKRIKRFLERLEDWVKDDIVTKGCKSLSGEGIEVSLGDIVLMAQVEYARDLYGTEVLKDCEVLAKWWERANKEKWCVKMEDLQKMEKEGFGVLL